MSSRPTWHIRFWTLFTKRGPDDCWLWTGPINRLGYGIIGRGKGKHDRAHRVSWELHNGPIPEGAHILHSCDVRRCVNPAHLRLGTHTDNMREMFSKGRRSVAKGERSARSKLTEAQVLDIRRRRAGGEKQITLAREFGIDKSQVWNIVTRKVWKHV